MVTAVPREEWQCQYRGGPCGEPRAVKDDGTLHHLCPEHRQRANLNQRRSQERRRRLRSRLLQASVETKAQADGTARRATTKQRSDTTPTGWHNVFTTPGDSTEYSSGMTLMSDSELFAPLMADLADAELPSIDDELDFTDDLFHIIAADLQDSLPPPVDSHHGNTPSL